VVENVQQHGCQEFFNKISSQEVLTFCRKFLSSYILITGLSNNLLIVKIPKAFYKSRLSCAEIEIDHTVRHRSFFEIYIGPKKVYVGFRFPDPT
jgi:hypothetical protein